MCILCTHRYAPGEYLKIKTFWNLKRSDYIMTTVDIVSSLVYNPKSKPIKIDKLTFQELQSFFIHALTHAFYNKQIHLYNTTALQVTEKHAGKKFGPEVIKLFSCSTQLSMKFQLLLNTKISTNKEVSCFKSLRCIYHANKCWDQMISLRPNYFIFIGYLKTGAGGGFRANPWAPSGSATDNLEVRIESAH